MNCRWECRLVQPLWKMVWRVLKKIKKGTILWPSVSASGYIPKITENMNFKDNMHRSVHCSITYDNQDMEATKSPSIAKWIKKWWYTALAGVAQWTKCQPTNQRVSRSPGWFPVGAYDGVLGLSLVGGHVRGNHLLISLTLSLPPPFCSLKINT